MLFVDELLNRLSNIFTRKSGSVLSQLLGAVGQELDKIPLIDQETSEYFISNNQVIDGDPVPTSLAQDFAISTASGTALDLHGNDWGVMRKLNEADDDYRRRIQAILPIYTNGPTVPAIKQIVKNFTGVDPIILEYGPDSFTMGVSPMGSFVFGDFDPFTFQVQVQNPNSVYYSQEDMEAAVNFAKPARSTATFIHNSGTFLDGSNLLDGTILLGG